LQRDLNTNDEGEVYIGESTPNLAQQKLQHD
jgi:hypothetical protein